MLVVGPNSGFSFSLCAAELQSLRYLAVPASGSQLRSRDVLPGALPALIAGDADAVGEEVPRERVPEPPGSAIAYVDGYGNLKTTVDEAPAPPGARVLVRIGKVSATAIVGDGTFAVAEGELALAPGSSGWRTRTGRQPRSMSCSSAVETRPSDSQIRARGRRCSSSKSIALPAARNRPRQGEIGPGRRVRLGWLGRRRLGLGSRRNRQRRLDHRHGQSTYSHATPPTRPAARRQSSSSPPCSPWTGSCSRRGTRAMLASTSSRSAGSPRRMSQRIPFG